MVESHDVSYVDQGIYVNGHRTGDSFFRKRPTGGSSLFEDPANDITVKVRALEVSVQITNEATGEVTARQNPGGSISGPLGRGSDP